MTQLPEWAPAGLDVTRPSAARIYDIGQWRPDPGDEPDPHPERLAGYAGVGREG